MHPLRPATLLAFSLLALAAAGLRPANAAVTKIVVESKQSPAFDGRTFGEAGQYEILKGKAYGEVDPRDRHNSIITDLDLAPRNTRGLVEYVSTFTLVKPVEAKKANGTLYYAVPNRGNRISVATYNVPGDSGEEFLYKRGFSVLHSGWQGDLGADPDKEFLTVPVAKNVDGSSITSPAMVRFSNVPTGTHTRALGTGRSAASLDTTRALLTRRASEGGAVIPLASTEWAFADCGKAPFPGEPDPGKISIKNGFDPAYLYEVTYTAKDPLVLGLGFAATRDINSFFRYERKDQTGTENPLAGAISQVIGQGVSQSGNFVRTFIHLGFNQDEANRKVWDGANAHIAARLLALNIRFANASGAANLYEPGSEGTLWWGKYEDKARGRAASSLLDRCEATDTCPKIMETCGSAEFWGLRLSPVYVGTSADEDIPLPANVRRYYFPSTPHGNGNGIFTTAPKKPAYNCELPDNPNTEAESMRALLLALNAWIKNGTNPPDNRYPRLAQGQLVSPTSLAMGFPAIPGSPLPDNLINTFYNYDLGPHFRYTDLSGVITSQPPTVLNTFPMLVPRTNADGNEFDGVPSTQLLAPLGTYTGWNLLASGFAKGRSAGFTGGYIPFAKTKSERLATGDPRPSLEERYTDHAGFVAAVRKATERPLAEGFLLREDADRLIKRAGNSDVLK